MLRLTHEAARSRATGLLDARAQLARGDFASVAEAHARRRGGGSRTCLAGVSAGCEPEKEEGDGLREGAHGWQRSLLPRARACCLPSTAQPIAAQSGLEPSGALDAEPAVADPLLRLAYRELAPSPALLPFVDRFWWTDEASAGGGPSTVSTVLPDGCIDLHVLVDDPGRETAIVGAMSKAVVLGASRSRIAAVRFRPGGATAFLPVSADEVTDRRVALVDVGARARELDTMVAQRDRSRGDARAVVDGIQKALLARLPSAPSVDGYVRRAVRRAFGPEAPGIEAIAHELGCSRQHLARVFARHVGLSPKAFARVARMQRSLLAIQTCPEEPLAAVALTLGYFDQAHLTRDFRLLTGLSPAEARRAKGSVFPIASLLAGLRHHA